MRYTAPSLSATSHSSRFQPLGRMGGKGLPALPAPPALPALPAHHSPDVRHGPAACTTIPPANPRRSVVTRTGRPFVTVTRAGTGSRQRRRADTTATTVNPDPAEPEEFTWV